MWTSYDGFPFFEIRSTHNDFCIYMSLCSHPKNELINTVNIYQFECLKKTLWLSAINSEIIGWKYLREHSVYYFKQCCAPSNFGSGCNSYRLWRGLAFPKCVFGLCVIILLADRRRMLCFHKNHNQYRFTCLCKLLIVFLCFLLFFGLLLLGTSRSIRRSRPTWTTWQESKPEAVKTHFKLFASLVWFQLQSTIDQSDGPIVTVVIAD